MGSTSHGLPYPEQTYSVDVVRDIQNLAEAVDSRVARQTFGQLVTGTTDANGIITFNHGLGTTPLWATATPFWGPMTDVLALIISVGIMAINGTIIQLRFRREDTHQFIPGNTFGTFVSYGY